MKPTFAHFGLMVVALLLAVPAAAQDPAATVVLVTGDATATAADGSRRALQRGDAVFPGDDIATAANSYLNLRFGDDGRLLLRPDSRFRIDEFRYPSLAPATPLPEQERAVAAEGRTGLSLLRGGFRAITGLIASANRDHYRVKTPLVTLGIRGTDYIAFVCDGQCEARAESGALAPKDGVAVGVISGGVFLENAQGRFDLGEGQFAMAVPDGGFLMLAHPPEVLGVTPIPDPKRCE